MRKKLKFSYYKSLGFIVSTTPQKIFKLNRVKWDKIKKPFLREKVFSHCNLFCTKRSIKFWDKITQHKKEDLLVKRVKNKLFDGFIFKHNSLVYKSLKDRILFKFLIPFFKLDVLLFFVGFCSTVHKSRQYIKEGFVKVNGSISYSTVLLKKGDCVAFCIQRDFFYRDTISQSCINDRLLSFLEIDFYNQQIYLLKDLIALSQSDIALLSVDFLDKNRL